MERILYIPGTSPIVIIVPHGVENPHLVQLAKECVKHSKAYGVLNVGFEISDEVDVLKDKANCDRIDHVIEDVVREEFLKPILEAKRQIFRKHKDCFIFQLHTFPADIEVDSENGIDIILGYGQAVVNNSFTCLPWVVDGFINEWIDHGWTANSVFCGQPGGRFSGRNINYLPQLFRKHYTDMDVQSLQVFITTRYLIDKSVAAFGGDILSNVITTLIKKKSEEVADREYVS